MDHFSVDRPRLIRGLAITALALAAVHILNVLAGGPSWQLERLFHLGRESNLPTWFSSLLLALASVAAYQCSRAERPGQRRRMWRLIAVGLLALSIDEVAMLHENLSDVLRRRLLPWDFLAHFKVTEWPVVLGPGVVAMLIWAGLILRRCLEGSARAGRIIMLGILMFVGGSWVLETATNFMNHDSLRWLRQIEIVLEESLEMLGTIVVLSGLLLHRELLQEQAETGKLS